MKTQGSSANQGGPSWSVRHKTQSEVGLLLLAAALTVALTIVALLGYGKWLAVVGVALGVGVLFTIDLSLLPACALAAFALLPTQYLSINTFHGALNPAIAVVVILGIRIVNERHVLRRGPHLAPLLLLALWILVRALVSPIRSTSMTWTLDFGVLVVGPALVLPGWSAAQARVEQCWLLLGGVLGFYGLVELALGRNPIYGGLFQSGGLAAGSGTYRITTTLGHPLLNGVFFAVAAVIGLGWLLRGAPRWAWAATLLSAAGIFGSASRGSALAVAIAVSVLAIASLTGGRRQFQTRNVVVALLLVGLVCGAGALYLAKRAGSSEAAGSTATREETYQAGTVLVRRYWRLGAGPGLTDKLKASMPIGDYQRSVESSAYEVLIDLGIPGVALLTWLLLTASLSSVRVRPELTASLIAYVVAASTFNLLDEYRPALVMVGTLIGVATCSRPIPAATL